MPRSDLATHRNLCGGQQDPSLIADMAWWGGTIAIGTGLAIWSGRFYQPMPALVGLVASAGVAGAVLGRLVGSTFHRRPWIRGSALVIPLVAAVVLFDAGTPADTGFVPDTWAGIRDYRGGCLSGTEYTAPGSALSITTDTVTITGSLGGRLQFTRTGQQWPSPARAEIWGSGITPADRPTRLALAAVGCP
ncbi:hypothetical protein [Amycolatopsis alba]|uniref:Uncharacterized protein n=1 Tax=Amycolatopsis alba DSM 44262 TaxID=1125972 RepID=A0A229R9L0_AMYAL|nr:hypothetical protein [Amycolatopsis alba]OXM43141.1 hypothetical protein CFP75_39770 [Amycolatopsis alba DSM 44262]